MHVFRETAIEGIYFTCKK